MKIKFIFIYTLYIFLFIGCKIRNFDALSEILSESKSTYSSHRPSQPDGRAEWFIQNPELWIPQFYKRMASLEPSSPIPTSLQKMPNTSALPQNEEAVEVLKDMLPTFQQFNPNFNTIEFFEPLLDFLIAKIKTATVHSETQYQLQLKRNHKSLDMPQVKDFRTIERFLLAMKKEKYIPYYAFLQILGDYLILSGGINSDDTDSHYKSRLTYHIFEQPFYIPIPAFQEDDTGKWLIQDEHIMYSLAFPNALLGVTERTQIVDRNRMMPIGLLGHDVLHAQTLAFAHRDLSFFKRYQIKSWEELTKILIKIKSANELLHKKIRQLTLRKQKSFIFFINAIIHENDLSYLNIDNPIPYQKSILPLNIYTFRQLPSVLSDKDELIKRVKLRYDFLVNDNQLSLEDFQGAYSWLLSEELSEVALAYPASSIVPTK